jgi:polygalacturonase
MVGYRGGAEEIPTVATVATIDAVEGEEDATARIQAAIDTVAALPLEERGALLFGAGTFRVLTTLYIRASGVVLRGQADGGTTLLSTSTTNADILLVVGSGDSSGEVAGTRVAITDDYVATGSFTLSVESTCASAIAAARPS